MPGIQRGERWVRLMQPEVARDRFPFIANYLAFRTETKEGRGWTEGWRVRRAPQGFNITWHRSGQEHPVFQNLTPEKVFELGRRRPLCHLIRRAEEDRIELLTKGNPVKPRRRP